MVLVVDDLLAVPAEFFQVIFNAVIQTAYKSAWVEYRRQLNIALIRAKRNHEEAKISKKEYKQIEEKVFAELRIANRVIGRAW
jgi:hypothetical protein